MQPRNMSMSGVVDLAAVKAAGEAKAVGLADYRIPRNATERYRNLTSRLALPPKPPQHLNPLFGPFHVRLRNPQIAPRC